jgi:D-sedoheptulose 7-phosphate isomerase
MPDDANADQPLATRLITTAAEMAGRVDPALLATAAGTLFDTWRASGVVLACGNGGSASTASHFAADVAKLTIVPGADRVRAVCLSDNGSAVTAWANDAGFTSIYAEQATAWLQPDSALVAFSVHGGARDQSVSANVGQACRIAREAGAAVIGITGFDGGIVGDLATVHINVPAYEEPIATPLIESVHVLIHHALCLALRERILRAGRSAG